MIKIHFQKALELIKTCSQESGLELSLHPEFDAIITHWLQSEDWTAPYVTDEISEAWLDCLLNDTSLGATSLEINFEEASGNLTAVPFPPPPIPQFDFIDLFAGIGGFRLALQEAGGRCLFSSEWDKAAKKTYFSNYGEYPFGDIRQFTGIEHDNSYIKKMIPDHKILVAGFPCQPFSRAGVSARNALDQSHGFACETQGTLFFDIARIVEAKKPDVLLLENVSNLKRHDKGKTFAIIKKTIEEELGYSFSYSIIDSSTLVPQRRKRLFMVCFKNGHKFKFPATEFEGSSLKLRQILEDSPDEKYTISEKLWAGHQRRTKRNLERGTGFTAFLADLDKPSNTLVARYGKDGKECLIPQNGGLPRMLTERECARLQGYPEDFIYSSSKIQAYRQFGNSVVVPVVEILVQYILNQMQEE